MNIEMRNKVICELWKTCEEGCCSHKEPHVSYGDCTTIGCSYMDDVICIPYQDNIIDVDELFEGIEL